MSEPRLTSVSQSLSHANNKLNSTWLTWLDVTWLACLTTALPRDYLRAPAHIHPSSIALSVCLVCLSCLSVCLSVCLAVLSVCLSVCAPIRRSVESDVKERHTRTRALLCVVVSSSRSLMRDRVPVLLVCLLVCWFVSLLAGWLGGSGRSLLACLFVCLSTLFESCMPARARERGIWGGQGTRTTLNVQESEHCASTRQFD